MGRAPLPADRYLAHREAAGRLRQETLSLAEAQPRFPSPAFAVSLPPPPPPRDPARSSAWAPALPQPDAPEARPETRRAGRERSGRRRRREGGGRGSRGAAGLGARGPGRTPALGPPGA
ncbi:pleckstrin homology domain-containing family H member 3-like [Pan paniscus]|uniref:pleckstrin homology domain-containing family H member 3-like n=1 Tax=Pan paniscus TaxID=9597 RepID=UPI002436AA1C|nr:pleckstrin homology domain-containing family H member 3-like [Pan paniscus]